MLAVLRPKSQVTIPNAIISAMGLKEGDQLDITEDAGSIRIMPVSVYPKPYVDQLRAEVNKLKDNLASGKQPVFDSIDDLFNKLEES